MSGESDSKKLEISPLIEVASIFQESFHSLGIKVTPLECEMLSRFLCECYGTRNRAFHDIGHALGVSEDCTPEGKFAGLFHDVVYKQVDHSRLKDLKSLFGVFDPGDSLELTIPAIEILDRDPWRGALVSVFGFKPGQKLGPFSGMNEFLSAWVAIQKLSPLLTPFQMIHVISCIEATIPFRGDQENPSAPERLFDNVKIAAATLNIKMSDKEVNYIIKDSVTVSNNDIKGFGKELPEVFIHNSWALLFEGNPSLQNGYYTISKYREPLQRMEGFLNSLNPKKIFTKYQGHPNENTLQELFEGALRNIGIGREYIRAKILDTAILEAFATISGGDCPIEIFTGTRSKSREGKALRIEDHLKWDLLQKKSDKRNETVRKLLADGRAFRSKFDMKTSLFAAYLYDALTAQEFEQSYAAACEMFKQQLSAENFLNTLPDFLVVHIGDILSIMAWTRSSAIQKFIQHKKSKKEAA